MSTREINRSVAKKLYEKFSRQWRQDLRDQGLYGMKNSPKKPKFNNWYNMHGRDLNLLRQSSPKDVQEYLHMPLDDVNWEQELANARTEVAESSERGVTTINIAGDED